MGRLLDISGDDQRFLMARYDQDEEVASRTILVQNWFTELRERTGR